MHEGIESALASRELPAREIGAMNHMMPKQGYLSDRDSPN
jgi:hypothetical protein